MTTRTLPKPLSNDQAETLADMFEAAEIGSPFSVTFDQPKVPHSSGTFDEYQKAWLFDPALKPICAALPEFWENQVHDVLQARRDAVNAQKETQRWVERTAWVERAVTHPGIRAYLVGLCQQRAREMREVEPVDLRHWAQQAAKEGQHKPAYRPAGGCSMKLKLSQAIRYGWTQEAYADHSFFAIPVEGKPEGEVRVCRENLGRFADALRTANGLAGFGSTYSLELHEIDGSWFVIANQRSSIAD